MHENLELRKENENLQETSASTMHTLSNLKIRIGDMVNEANSRDEQAVMEALT